MSSARSNYSRRWDYFSLNNSTSIIIFVLGDAIPIELLEEFWCECSLDYFKREIHWESAKAIT